MCAAFQSLVIIENQPVHLIQRLNFGERQRGWISDVIASSDSDRATREALSEHDQSAIVELHAVILPTF